MNSMTIELLRLGGKNLTDPLFDFGLILEAFTTQFVLHFSETIDNRKRQGLGYAPDAAELPTRVLLMCSWMQ
jgi:hypothetical protein